MQTGRRKSCCRASFCIMRDASKHSCKPREKGSNASQLAGYDLLRRALAPASWPGTMSAISKATVSRVELEPVGRRLRPEGRGRGGEWARWLSMGASWASMGRRGHRRSRGGHRWGRAGHRWGRGGHPRGRGCRTWGSAVAEAAPAAPGGAPLGEARGGE